MLVRRHSQEMLRKRRLPRELAAAATEDEIYHHLGKGGNDEHRRSAFRREQPKRSSHGRGGVLTKQMRTSQPVAQRISAHRPFWKSHSQSLWGINYQTWQAVALLAVAIVISLQVNRFATLPGVPALLKSLCAQRSVLCHASLGVAPERNRTILAQDGPIAANQVVLQIPKEYTIWDIDALRDPWIYHHVLLKQQQQQTPSLVEERKILTSAAYLGLFLARLLYQDPPLKHHRVQHAYLSTLPQTLDAFRHHPAVWSETEVETWIGRFTSTYNHVQEMRYQLREEYDVFARLLFLKGEEELAKPQPFISWERYLIGRLNVMTRSFGTGPLFDSLEKQVASSNQSIITMQEIQYYQSTFGIDLSNGFHVMVPILDQLNHHGQQHNVGFHYDASQQSFVVKALRNIVRGTEVIDNYGKRTHADLFAKYGFIQASDPTGDYSEATIALWHSYHRTSYDDAGNTSTYTFERHFARQMLRYLQYDDGYDRCVVDPESVNRTENIEDNDMKQAWSLKQAKYQHMLNIVGKQSPRWVFRIPPRKNRNNSPPKIENWHRVLSTCRLMVLTHNDYNDSAIELLQSNRHNTSFYLLPKSTAVPSVHHIVPGDALEFRTYMCMARILQTAMSRFPKATVDKQLEFMANLPRTSRDWTMAHLQLQELRTLDAAKQLVFQHLHHHYPRQMMISASSRSTLPSQYSMRDEPCSFLQLQALLRQSER